MTLKTIEIDEAVYKKLLERKKEDETISDVIAKFLNISKKPQNIKNFIGLWRDLPKEFFDQLESDRKSMREEINRRFAK
ncbi:MAG: antitoxin VapB family protein [Promethearchaeia archaeon]